MYSKEQIKNDLQNLGISRGDMLFVRISYRAIGKVEGGPKTVIDAILEVIGEDGTLLATAFPQRIRSYSKWLHRNHVYRQGMKASTGAIPTVMASYPQARYSSNPISPYVAIGKYAEYLTSKHTPESESYDIVKQMIEHFNPKCLRIGGNVLDGTAHLAFSDGLRSNGYYQRRLPEGMYYMDGETKKWKERTVSAFCYEGFRKFFTENISNNPDAVLSEGKIGDGVAVVTSMRNTLKIERELITPRPSILMCTSPKCLMCRLSYSYSDTSIPVYLWKSIPRYFSKGWKHELGAIRTIFNASLFGKKCI